MRRSVQKEVQSKSTQNKSHISATSACLSLFLSNQIFSPSVCSWQNKLWLDLLTDVSLITRKNQECLVPWLYWIMNYFEIPVSDMLIDVCQHCPSKKSFIKTKTRHTGQPWAHIRQKEDWKDIFGGMFMCQVFETCGVEYVGEWLLFGHFKKRN